MAKEEKPTEEKPTEETEETTDEVEEDVDSTEETETSDFKPKFTQLQAKDKEEYLSKLEDAYLNSSKEGQRIRAELTDREQELQVLAKIVGSDPDLKSKMASKLYDEGYDDPFSDGISKATLTQVMREVMAEELPKQMQNVPAIKRLEEEKTQADKAVYDEFVNLHPEIVTDPDLGLNFEEAVGAQFRILDKKGLKPDIKTVMDGAWKMVGGTTPSHEDAELEGMTKMAQKEASSMSGISTSGAAKSGGKRSLTPQEESIAKMMGLTPEQYLEGKKLKEESDANL